MCWSRGLAISRWRSLPDCLSVCLSVWAVRDVSTPWPTDEGVRRLLLIVAAGRLLSRGWLGGCELSELLRPEIFRRVRTRVQTSVGPLSKMLHIYMVLAWLCKTHTYPVWGMTREQPRRVATMTDIDPVDVAESIISQLRIDDGRSTTLEHEVDKQRAQSRSSPKTAGNRHGAAAPTNRL